MLLVDLDDTEIANKTTHRTRNLRQLLHRRSLVKIRRSAANARTCSKAKSTRSLEWVEKCVVDYQA